MKGLETKTLVESIPSPAVESIRPQGDDSRAQGQLLMREKEH